MTNRQIFFVIALAAAAIVFVVITIYQLISPGERALKKAKRGDTGGAEADLKARLAAKGEVASLRAALGKVYSLAGRNDEAADQLRRAVALGSRSAGTLNALGWALVRLGHFDEALPIAAEANGKAREDFEVDCLYCGLMARAGRHREVADLFQFIETTAAQVRKMSPGGVLRPDLAEKHEFARSPMLAAGPA